jgi:hypothetical protein
MSNIKNIQVHVSGLDIDNIYSYTFSGAGGNWPATIIGSTGILVSNSKNSEHSIDAVINFCATTGSCYDHPNLLDYSLENCHTNNSNVFTLLNFSLYNQTTSEHVAAKKITVDCTDCIVNPSIELVSAQVLSSGVNTSPISAIVSNVTPGDTYYYEFYAIDGNWPIWISNISGTIVPQNSSLVLNSSLMFPESSGLFVGDNNLLSNSTECLSRNHIYSVVGMSLTNKNCQSDPILSNNILIECNDCLPNPTIDNISDLSLTTTSKIDLTSTIRNLHQNTTYNYQYHSIAGNWPVNMNNISGSFIANDSMFRLKTQIAFCDSSGVCSVSNNSILNPSLTCLDKDGKYLTAYLYIEAADCDYPSCVSNHFTITCDDCLSKPEIVLPADAMTDAQDYDLSVTFNDLIIGHTYSYSFVGTYSNWPVVLDPASGTIIANSGSETIANKVVFCFPTGDALGQAGLLDYSVNGLNQDYAHKFAKFRVNIIDNACSDINVHSKEFTLTCDSCLPCLNCSTIFFSGSPTISLPTGCCSGTDMMFVHVTGANPDSAYRYELSSLSGSVNFVPSTGLVYVKNNGSSIIPVLMSTNLVNKEQALAQAKLIDINTNGESIGFLGFICGSGCTNEDPNL